MAKDPAFLFYTGDFSTGTQFFSDEQVGKFIRLLMAQHQHGHLTEKHMMHICKTYDNEVFEKFAKDAEGLFYNERLETEILKRKRFTDSRSDNRKGINNKPLKKKNISKSYVKHMENENKDENVNKNKEKKEIIYPFDSENFKNAWQLWKEFKKEQFNFTYKTIGEQGALVDLAKLSGGNESHAIKLIHHAIGKNWKGIYQINENGQTTKTGEITIDELRKEVARQSGS